MWLTTPVCDRGSVALNVEANRLGCFPFSWLHPFSWRPLIPPKLQLGVSVRSNLTNRFNGFLRRSNFETVKTVADISLSPDPELKLRVNESVKSTPPRPQRSLRLSGDGLVTSLECHCKIRTSPPRCIERRGCAEI